jgi:hypothetical protein
MHNEHKRHQHRYLPGEVTRQFKTAMREGRGLVKAWKVGRHGCPRRMRSDSTGKVISEGHQVAEQFAPTPAR